MVVDMSKRRRRSIGEEFFETVVTSAVKGLGQAIIGEVLGHHDEHKSDASKPDNVIHMRKTDDNCWEMIDNE
jgi:hypothetical protein